MKTGQGGPLLNGSLVDCGIVLCEALDDRGNRLIQRKSPVRLSVPMCLTRRFVGVRSQGRVSHQHTSRRRRLCHQSV